MAGVNVSQLEFAMGNLGSALAQSLPSDDRIIMDRVRKAHEIICELWRNERYPEKPQPIVREISATEADVIEAAMELASAQSAYDAGCPAQEMMKRAHNYLIDRCADLAAEGDGMWRRP